MNKHHYIRLMIMTVLSFPAMYLLMYAMVDSFSNVFSNFNQAYMAGLMAAPMVLIELALMSAMYPNKKWNALIATASVIALVLFWLGIRRQVAISDKQFLRSRSLIMAVQSLCASKQRSTIQKSNNYAARSFQASSERLIR